MTGNKELGTARKDADGMIKKRVMFDEDFTLKEYEKEELSSLRKDVLTIT